MRREGATPKELIDGLSGWHQTKMKQLRRLVRSSCPTVSETVRSGVLYYEDDGDVLALAAQKHYVSLYVLAPGVMAANQELLTDLNHGKGCIRFRATTEVPEDRLAELLRRAAMSSERDCRAS